MDDAFSIIKEEALDSFEEKLIEFEKDIYNHELLFIKYVNNYVYLSKGVSEDHLNELAEKYNKDGIVLSVINELDSHHNEKKCENGYKASLGLMQLSNTFSSLNKEEKLKFINENPEFLSYIKRNTEWLDKLSSATGALMYTVQELI